MLVEVQDKKRLWLNFEIARRARELQLPVSFHYAGNFNNELPQNFEYAHYYGPIHSGIPMFEFIKDRHALLLTSRAEGLFVLLIEAIHWGIVPIESHEE